MGTDALNLNTNFSTLVDVLRQRTAAQGADPAYRFILDDEKGEITWSYADLDLRARAIAAALQSRNLTGQRALLLYPPGLDYLAAFFGCLYAGVTAVPAYPPRPNRSLSRIQSVLADSTANIALTTTSIMENSAKQIQESPSLFALEWLTTEDLDLTLAESWSRYTPDPNDLAFLQYTSGSTGNPKGVMVSHGNLIHNVQMIHQGFQLDVRRDRGVVWLPMYHDMGLIGGVLEALYAGGLVILLSPVAFLRRPVTWLETISKYGGTVSGAPNFGYELCVEKITPAQRANLDLSSWRVAFCGAEPVRQETLRRFVETFGPCGFKQDAFYPCFGMAESTLIVTGGNGPARPQVLTVDKKALSENRVVPQENKTKNSITHVANGGPLLDQEVIIVDPETCLPLEEDHVGEVWTKGDSVAQGYWNRPAETAEAFHGTLADSGKGPYLRTGDLGYFHEGQLYIAGRFKDLIIIRGSNHYPQDIELTVENADISLSPNCGAAFSIDVDGEERLVVLQEVDRSYRNDDLNLVLEKIREAITREHQIQVYEIVLIRALTIPKTSSGKIQRRACRQAYLDGDLKELHRWQQPSGENGQQAAAEGASPARPHSLDTNKQFSASAGEAVSSEQIEEWLTAKLANHLKIARKEIDVSKPFDQYGLDSLAAVTLSADLEDYLGRRLSPTLVYEHPTIRAIARHLASDETSGTPEAAENGVRPVLSDEPIAIIGMSCRFPGGANDPDSYWKLMFEGRDAITNVPLDRWDAESLYDPDPDAPGKMSTRWGGFLDKVDQFDSQFFSIAPREAMSMDPQQRLLLEVSWEALENAGQSPEGLEGTQTGVFAGICTSDYSHILSSAGGRDRIDAYTGTGNAFSVASGRLSYLLGLQGPNFPVDTACSSSLVAVHLACQSLRSGECRQALAAGVNMLLSPDAMIYFSKVHAMAADGRCKTFDESADGYVRGEGCGVVVLKRLSDAVADGDNVLAVVRGSAINHDGRSNGLTAPNGTAQERVIRQAVHSANIAPHEVDYIEAHGTGTSLGDPVEVRALGRVLSENRDENQKLRIGSVKTNIGHLEAAAGIASLIKVVLALQHEKLPAHLHLNRPNPLLPLEQYPIEIPTEQVDWSRGKRRRIAGISSFGFSGTNAHLVVEEAPRLVPSKQDELQRPVHILPLSARSEPALAALAESYQQHLRDSSAELSDICYTAASGRSHFGHRAALIASSKGQLAERLADLQNGKKSPGVFSGHVPGSSQPKVGFLFTGQGAQYVGMARELYDTQPTFRKAIDQCHQILRPLLNQPLLPVLYPDLESVSVLDETAYTQPALFAVEYGLAQLWNSWGIRPAAVLGHSVGQYVAAVLAGVFSLEEGLTLIAHRGRLMQALPRAGRMVACMADEKTVAAAVAPFSRDVSIAALNAPQQTVISGRNEAVQTILTELAAAGIETAPLATSHAFHSPLMEPMLEEFRQCCNKIKFQKPQIPLICNTSGKRIGDEVATADYWCNHVLEPVRFKESIETLEQESLDVLIEIGPRPTLLGLAQRCFTGDPLVCLPSLRQGKDAWQTLLPAVAQLYSLGARIDWKGFDQDYTRQKVSLPTYPFQRERHWISPENGSAATAISAASLTPAKHPLIGHRLRSALKDVQFETTLSRTSPEYLQDHRVFDHVIVPATAFIEIGLAAAREVTESSQITLSNFAIQQPLVLHERTARTVQVIVSPENRLSGSVSVYCLQQDQTASNSPAWALQATVEYEAQEELASPESAGQQPIPLEELCQTATEQPIDEFYERLQERGLQYGPRFRGITKLYQPAERESIGKLELPRAIQETPAEYSIHPVLLDASLQLIAAAFGSTDSDDVYLPLSAKQIHYYGSTQQELYCRVRLHPSDESQPQAITADLDLTTCDGNRVAHIEGLLVKRADRGTMRRYLQENIDDLFYESAWQPSLLSSAVETASTEESCWILVTDQDQPPEQIAERLRLRGDRCVSVKTGNRYEKRSDEQYTIQSSSYDDYARLISDVRDSLALPCRGVVYFCNSQSEENRLPEENVAAQEEASSRVALYLTQSLAQAGFASPPRLWFVTRATQAVRPGSGNIRLGGTTLWGLGRVIALEHPELNCVRLDLDNPQDRQEAERLYAELIGPDGEDQVAYRSGVRYVLRMVRKPGNSLTSTDNAKATPNTPYKLRIDEYGVLDNLYFHPIERPSPGPGQVEVQVEASGLNLRDVLHALGMLEEYSKTIGIESAGEMPFGFECAGRISAVGEGVDSLSVGTPVIAALAIGSFASHVLVDARFVAPRHEAMTAAEGATIPTTFLTASYGLETLAKLKAGQRVLIHAAAGGVGQAAVQIAQAAGAEVFATASPGKWDTLRALGIEHVMNSRTTEFAQYIQEATDGQGVDVVLNSLNGEFIPKSLESLAQDGKFIEIGKIGVWSADEVRQSRSDVEYFPFDLSLIAQQNPEQIAELLIQLMHRFAQNELRPLPYTATEMQDVVSAFQFLGQAKNIGKVVVTQPKQAENVCTDRQIRIRAKQTYLITGGLGALGLKIAKWLIQRGARHLVLTSRGEPSPAAAATIRRMEESGAKIVTVATDVSAAKQVKQLIQSTRESMPPIAGVIHAAGVLDDGILLQQDWERFERVFAPKVAGGWNLHTATQDQQLDFFVEFSSIASMMGSPGQSNYAAANAFLDSLAHYRRAHGLPALSINWGPWGESGMAADLGSRNSRMFSNQGITMLSSEHGLLALEQLLEAGQTQASVVEIDWTQFLSQNARLVDSPFLAELVSASAASLPQRGEMLKKLTEADPQQRYEMLIEYLSDHINEGLGFQRKLKIDLNQPLIELGLDSLMAVQLINLVRTDLGVDIPVEQLTNISSGQLADAILNQLGWSNDSDSAQTAPVPSVTSPAAEEEEMEEFTI